MIRTAITLAACALLSACASISSYTGPEDWDRSDTGREITFQLLNAVDAVQTSEIRDRPDVQEVGPIARTIMGAEPSGTDVALYFGSMAISHYLISRALPPRLRQYWQIGSIGERTYWVYNNCAKYSLAC